MKLFLVAPILNAQNKDSYINQALRISLSTIEQEFKEYIQIKESISYNKENKNLIYEKFIVFFELDLYSKPISINSNHDFSTLFCELILKESLGLLTWSKKKQLI